MPLEKIKTLMRHKTLDMTLRYIIMTQKDYGIHMSDHYDSEDEDDDRSE